MKTIRKKVAGVRFIIVFCLTGVLTSCSNEVDFGEQYKKTVYIVNSNNLLHVGEHSFETENDTIAVSVYCASSQPLTHDLQVRLKVNRHALDSLNALQLLADPGYANRVMLPDDNYQLNGEQYVTIKAGKQYGILSVPFDFSGLDPSIPYALPLSLVSNNADYDINPKLKSIVYQIEMVNRFAGNYNGSSRTSPATIVGIQPLLKALSVNKVRMPVHNLSDEDKDLLTNFMVLTVAEDNSVSISPWGIADVTDLGGSKYDPVTQTFELYYQFTDASAKRQTVHSVIRNIDAPPTEEDEL
ncbi:BT_3044 domain-containing protein [Proteiniphilum sp. X52]|uniref:BT_3044 domain-containing protein n=1 Tax=Proteiniphilum sp. X52 TaxID=2382159 RepID=UPI00131494F8|nr:DUF4361 domain-containing protein [Proteiniphilum sp. X52]